MWIFAVVRFTRSGFHPSLNRTAEMVLLWSLLMTLWLPWFADGSGYRLLFTSLGKAAPHSMALSFSGEPGESERALREYYAGIRTHRFELDRNIKGSDLFLIECGSEAKDLPAEATWRLIWEGKKPCEGRPKEIFRFFSGPAQAERENDPSRRHVFEDDNISRELIFSSCRSDSASAAETLFPAPRYQEEGS